MVRGRDMIGVMYKIRNTVLSSLIALIIATSGVMAGMAASVYEDFVSNNGYTSAASAEVIEDVLANGPTYGFSKTEIEKIKQDYDKYKEDPENNDSYLLKAGNKVSNIAKKAVVDNKLGEMGVGFDISANVEQAGVALSGIEDFVAVVIGILCILVTLGMSLFTAIDLCYITMPVFRNKCEDMKQSGGGMAKTSSNGETKFRFVTDEAVYAVQTCSIETGKQPLGVYLKKRVWAFVLLGVVLFVLLTGNIQLIVNIAVNAVAGLIEALGNLGV